MANLLATQAGIDTLNRIACFLGRRRMSRNLKRSFYIAFDAWKTSGYFDKSVLLNQLNELTQDELVDLNTLLGELGCLEATLSAMTIYVDPVNGSDVSGDGSSSHPYASLYFIGNLPRTINHNVRVMLLNDLDMGTDALNLNFTIGPNGCFSLIGRSAPTPVTTSAGPGPFTVTGATSYGTASISDYGHVLTFADTWGVDELYGKWIKYESGSNQGQAYQIHKNNANDIYIRGGCFANPAIGNTVSIIEPAITLSCQRINLECTGPENDYAVISASQGLDSSRLNLMNLKIDLRGTYTEYSHFVLKSSVKTQVSFVDLITNNLMENAIVLKSNVNQYPSSDIDISIYTLSSISNIDCLATAASACGILLYNVDFLPPDFTLNSLVIDGADTVRCIDTRGLVRIIGNVQDCLMNAFGLVVGYNSPVCYFHRNMVDGAAAAHSIHLINCGDWQCASLFFTSPGLDVFFLQQVNLHVVSNSINFDPLALFTGFAFNYSFLGSSTVVINHAPTTLSGATANDIWFPGGVGGVAFPGADAQQTNALGCEFNYVATP